MIDFSAVAMVTAVGGAIITVGTILAWYNGRIEARVIIQRRLNHLENDFAGHKANVVLLHDEQDKELKALHSEVSRLKHESTNLYWMIKTVLAKMEISASSLGFNEDDRDRMP